MFANRPTARRVNSIRKQNIGNGIPTGIPSVVITYFQTHRFVDPNTGQATREKWEATMLEGMFHSRYGLHFLSLSPLRYSSW